MTEDHTQARLQRMEAHLKSVDERVSVLSAVEDASVKERIVETFGEDPRLVVIYRGVQRGMTQQSIAEALKERGLPGTQQRVSDALNELSERGFLRPVPKGGFVPREGWDDFGLERVLKKTLRREKIDDLP